MEHSMRVRLYEIALYGESVYWAFLDYTFLWGMPVYWREYAMDRTDLETLKAMLDRVEIDYEVKVNEEYTSLTVERGYAGFATTFTFTVEGMLQDMGAYE